MNWEQLKTILWLRGRLLRNQWSRRGGLGAVIAVLVGFSAIAIAGLGFTSALLGAAFGLADAKPVVIMGVWLGVTGIFLFFWTVGLLNELQRSEMIDLSKLMHLPAALGQLFAVNYLVSHFTLSIVIMVPVMLGLAIGLAIARGPEMLLLIPLALSMVVMISAWTYYVRGWLAAMMTNPRRRRTVIMCISAAFILLLQGPNLYFNVFNRHSSARQNPETSASSDYWKHRQESRQAAQQEIINKLIAAQGFIPPLWVSVGAQGLAERRILPALFGTLGCLGIATLGLLRAYRSSVKFYHGDTGRKLARRNQVAAASAKTARAPVKSGNRFLEWHLPGVPEQPAALALATFRSLLRAPEVKMAWGGSMVSILIIGGMLFLRTPPHLSDAVKPLAATASVVFTIFMMIQFFTNQFGFDRDGFRSLILSPVERRLILLGKNLAVLPVGFCFGTILLALVAAWLNLSPLVMVATLCQLLTVLLIVCLGGNLLSILLPFRIQPGTMKPTKMPGLVILVMVLCQLLFPVAMAPVFISPLLELLWRHHQLSPLVPVNLIGSLVFCGVMIFVYSRALAPLGRLLQRRETKILGVVTVEVE